MEPCLKWKSIIKIESNYDSEDTDHYEMHTGFAESYVKQMRAIANSKN